MISIEEYGNDMSQITDYCSCAGCQQMRLLSVLTVLEEQGGYIMADARVLLHWWRRQADKGRPAIGAPSNQIEEDAFERCTAWVRAHRRDIRMLSGVIGWSGGPLN